MRTAAGDARQPLDRGRQRSSTDDGSDDSGVGGEACRVDVVIYVRPVPSAAAVYSASACRLQR